MLNPRGAAVEMAEYKYPHNDHPFPETNEDANDVPAEPHVEEKQKVSRLIGAIFEEAFRAATNTENPSYVADASIRAKNRFTCCSCLSEQRLRFLAVFAFGFISLAIALLSMAMMNHFDLQSPPHLAHHNYANLTDEYEPHDGFYNNLAHPDWGAVDRPLIRTLPIAYADGVYQPSGQNRPNVRRISEITMKGSTGHGSLRNLTALAVFYGQQLVEEVLDAQKQGCPVEYFNIPIPKCDELYDPDCTGTQVIPFTRTRYSFKTGYSPNVPRQQLNEITPYLDGGLFYGTARAISDALRSFKDGELAAADETPHPHLNFPAVNKIGLPLVNPPVPIYSRILSAKRFFVTGNPRGNENPMLLSMHILWYREHNYHAKRLKALHPDWSDERLFTAARKWTIAMHQHITLDEWIPAWLSTPLPPYSGYNINVNPQISDIFQAAAMRFGHTLVPPGIFRRNAQCQFRKTSELTGFPGYIGLRVCNSFFNGQAAVRETDIDEIFMGLASQIAEREDNIITPDLRGFVFGPLHHTRRDLMALNMQRGRDHGLPDYNTAREVYGLPRIVDWKDVYPDDPSRGEKLKQAYEGDINNIDIWAGGILESGPQGPGPLFRKVLLDQFSRIRDGDRFYYKNTLNKLFTPQEIAEIDGTTLYDILLRNTAIPPDAIQKDVFHFKAGDPCPQPKQLNGTVGSPDMEQCTPVFRYQYFSISETQIPIVIGSIFAFVVAVVSAIWFFQCWERRRMSRVAIRKFLTAGQSLSFPADVHKPHRAVSSMPAVKNVQSTFCVSLVDENVKDFFPDSSASSLQPSRDASREASREHSREASREVSVVDTSDEAHPALAVATNGLGASAAGSGNLVIGSSQNILLHHDSAAVVSGVSAQAHTPRVISLLPPTLASNVTIQISTFPAVEHVELKENTLNVQRNESRYVMYTSASADMSLNKAPLSPMASPRKRENMNEYYEEALKQGGVFVFDANAIQSGDTLTARRLLRHIPIHQIKRLCVPALKQKSRWSLGEPKDMNKKRWSRTTSDVSYDQQVLVSLDHRYQEDLFVVFPTSDHRNRFVEVVTEGQVSTLPVHEFESLIRTKYHRQQLLHQFMTAVSDLAKRLAAANRDTPVARSYTPMIKQHARNLQSWLNFDIDIDVLHDVTRPDKKLSSILLSRPEIAQIFPAPFSNLSHRIFRYLDSIENTKYISMATLTAFLSEFSRRSHALPILFDMADVRCTGRLTLGEVAALFTDLHSSANVKEDRLADIFLAKASLTLGLSELSDSVNQAQFLSLMNEPLPPMEEAEEKTVSLLHAPADDEARGDEVRVDGHDDGDDSKHNSPRDLFVPSPQQQAAAAANRPKLPALVIPSADAEHTRENSESHNPVVDGVVQVNGHCSEDAHGVTRSSSLDDSDGSAEPIEPAHAPRIVVSSPSDQTVNVPATPLTTALSALTLSHSSSTLQPDDDDDERAAHADVVARKAVRWTEADDVDHTEASKFAPTKTLANSMMMKHTIPEMSNSRGVLTRLRMWMRTYRLELYWLCLYVIFSVCIFIERFHNYKDLREHRGLRRILGVGVSITRGAASGIMFNMALLLFTNCRTILTMLRSTSLNRVFPFDATEHMHAVAGVGLAAWSCLHIVGHFFNFFNISSQPTADLSCLFREVHWNSDELPDFVWWMFQTPTGWSGVILTVGFIFFYAFTFARKSLYPIFRVIHGQWYWLYFMTWVHGSYALIQDPPSFIDYIIIPLMMFNLDRLLKYSRLTHPLPIVDARIYPGGNAVELRSLPPSMNFSYHAGQYGLLTCAAISSAPHAFTYTSAPEDDLITFHIHAEGQWTTKLMAAFKRAFAEHVGVPRDRWLWPEIVMDGPYGQAEQDWNASEVSILVGTGIGITPFSSILKQFIHKFTSLRRDQFMRVKRLYLIWATNELYKYGWMVDVIRQVEKIDTEGVFSAQIYLTRPDQYDLRTQLMRSCEGVYHQSTGLSLMTGLKASTHFGRPDFEGLLMGLKERHFDRKKLSVFAVGSEAVTRVVAESVRECNSTVGPRIVFKHSSKA